MNSRNTPRLRQDKQRHGMFHVIRIFDRTKTTIYVDRYMRGDYKRRIFRLSDVLELLLNPESGKVDGSLIVV